MEKTKRFKGNAFLLLLLIAGALVAYARMPEETQQNIGKILSTKASVAVLDTDISDDPPETRLKVVIAVDTSKTMDEEFINKGNLLNAVQSTSILVDLLASEPNTYIQYVPFCRDANQEEYPGYGEEDANNQMMVKMGFFRLDTKLQSVKHTLACYEMPKNQFTSLNIGIEKAKDLILDDTDDDFARYALILLTDGETEETEFTNSVASIESLLKRDVGVFTIYPQGKMKKKALRKIRGASFEAVNPTSIPITDYTDLLEAYLTVYASVVGTDRKISFEAVEPETAVLEDAHSRTYSYIVEGYHCGISAAIPSGYEIEKISIMGAYNKPIILFSADENTLGEMNNMVYIDREEKLDIDKDKTYEYRVQVRENQCEEQTQTKQPVFYVLKPLSDRFCTKVFAAGTAVEKTGTGSSSYYGVNHGSDILVQFNYFRYADTKNAQYTLDDYDIRMDGILIDASDTTHRLVKKDTDLIELILPAAENLPEAQHTISVENRYTKVTMETIKLDIVDLPPILDLENKHPSVELRGANCGVINAVFGEEDWIKVPLDGIAKDPEGQTVEYYLKSSHISECGQYRFDVVQNSDGYHLMIEKTNQWDAENTVDVLITIGFRDQNGNGNEYDFNVVKR